MIIGSQPKSSKGNGFMIFIVLFLLSVITGLGGYLYYTSSANDKKIERKLSDAQAEFEKKQIETETDSAAREAKLIADYEKKQLENEANAAIKEAKLLAETKAKADELKKREDQVLILEERVNQELNNAATAVRDANQLKREATTLNTTARDTLIEAQKARETANASGSEKDRKLAEEKTRIAEEAAELVAAANLKVQEAVANAKIEADKAIELKANLDKVKEKLMESNQAIKNRIDESKVLIKVDMNGELNGKYCNDYGENGVVCDSMINSERNQFYLQPLFVQGGGDDGRGLIIANSGLYCTTTTDNKLVCDKYDYGYNEIFKFDGKQPNLNFRAGRNGLYCNDTDNGIICNNPQLTTGGNFTAELLSINRNEINTIGDIRS